MRHVLLKICWLLAVIMTTSFAQERGVQWALQLGGPQQDQGADVALNRGGDFMVTGSFAQTLHIESETYSAAGFSDLFIAKFDTSGRLRWVEQAGAEESAIHGWSIAVDEAGNSLITGLFNGAVQLGGERLLSKGAADIFVAKYNADGAVLWARQAGGRNQVYPDQGKSVTFDREGNGVVVGTFNDSARFGDTNLAVVNGANIFIAKYDPDGNLLWVRAVGGGTHGLEEPVSVCVDRQNHIVVTGDFAGTGRFGDTTLVSNGGFDMFIAKYRPDGSLLWVKQIGGKGHDWGADVVTDRLDNLIVTGGFQGKVLFQRKTVYSRDLSFDVYLAKFDPGGRIMWVRSAGGSNTDSGTGVAVDPDNQIYLSGYYKERTDFAGRLFTSAGERDIFVAKYTQGGALRWAQSIGGPGNDEAWSVTAVDTGSSIVTGYFSGTVRFRQSELTSRGNGDIFLTRLEKPGDWETLLATQSAPEEPSEEAVLPGIENPVEGVDEAPSAVAVVDSPSAPVKAAKSAVPANATPPQATQPLSEAEQPSPTATPKRSEKVAPAARPSQLPQKQQAVTAAPESASGEEARYERRFSYLNDSMMISLPTKQLHTFAQLHSFPSRNSAVPLDSLLGGAVVTATESTEQAPTGDRRVPSQPEVLENESLPQTHEANVPNRREAGSVENKPSSEASLPLSAQNSAANPSLAGANAAEPGFPEKAASPSAGELPEALAALLAAPQNDAARGDIQFYLVHPSWGIGVGGRMNEQSRRVELFDLQTHQLLADGDFRYSISADSQKVTLTLEKNPPSRKTLPVTFDLAHTYTNPYNLQAEIRYQLPRASRVIIEAFDASGKKIRSLVDEYKEPGYYTVKWNGRTDDGQPLASGVYIYRMKAGDFEKSRKMLFLWR